MKIIQYVYSIHHNILGCQYSEGIKESAKIFLR